MNSKGARASTIVSILFAPLVLFPPSFPRHYIAFSLEVIGTGSEATTYRFYVKTGTRFMGTAVSGRGHPSCCIVDLELIKTLLPLTAK